MTTRRTFIELRKNLNKAEIKDVNILCDRFKPLFYKSNVLGFEYDDTKPNTRYLFRKKLLKTWGKFIATTNTKNARKQFNNKQTMISLANSSNISSYAYNPYTQNLTIQFEKGTQYKYKNVPSEVVMKMLVAQERKNSLGRVFIDEVRNKYECKKIDTVVAP